MNSDQEQNMLQIDLLFSPSWYLFGTEAFILEFNDLEPDIKLNLASSFKQLLKQPGLKTMHKMLQRLTVTFPPWLHAHTGPLDIVSVSVTSCISPTPLKCACLHLLMHAHTMDGRVNVERVILSTITAGLLEERTPITANQTEPNTAPVHQPPFHPAAATPDTPFSPPGSVAFPLVIAVRRPAVCYKWDKLQRLGDASVGGCKWVAMAASIQDTRERDERLGLWV